MYRIKVMSANRPNEYRWYKDAQTAHLVAIAIIRNKDAEAVAVENLKAKMVEQVYHI